MYRKYNQKSNKSKDRFKKIKIYLTCKLKRYKFKHLQTYMKMHRAFTNRKFKMKKLKFLKRSSQICSFLTIRKKDIKIQKGQSIQKTIIMKNCKNKKDK